MGANIKYLTVGFIMCFVMICYTKEQKHIIFYQIYKRNWGTYPV